MNVLAKIAATMVAFVVVVGGGFLVANGGATATSAQEGEGTTGTTVQFETEAVQLRNLTDSKDFDGQVKFGAEWSLPIKLEGTVTARHPKGTVVKAGEPLIWVNAKAAFFAYGDTPLYRELSKVETTGGQRLMQGDDVTQLQEFLLAQGYNDKERLEVDGVFGHSTERAVKAWQKANGFDETGKITASQLIFVPEDLRISSEPRVGSVFAELTVSESDQKLIVSASRRDAKYLKEGARVDIVVDPTTTIAGVVSAVTEVTDSESGETKLEATITPDDPLPDSTTTATVTGTATSIDDAVTVSVRALVALSQGGYALEVDLGGGKTELRKIEVGEILDGFAQISGDVNAGDQVVVAKS
ncbi:MAG TPA: hypothetical protein ENH15_01980 [Actinobacteria bacterium]|nr:hypothetical protein [Actinomycetota bacterium]